MLKPIHRVDCSPALAACQSLMQRFALWLCDPATTGTHITQQNLESAKIGSKIETDWLWSFLQRVDDGQTLLTHAQTVANMVVAQKTDLAAWIDAVANLPNQFKPAPTPWPTARPLASKADWEAFRLLMEAFYKKGFCDGRLPYLANGTHTATGGVNYNDYKQAFRLKHRLNPKPDARQVCVFCGGLLDDSSDVDHWVIKSAYPLLSICANNLTLICSTCNQAPNKGKKHVHANGSFQDWFHPYLRPGNGIVRLAYKSQDLSVHSVAKTAADQPKVDALDKLLNLGKRWTREFKAEYVKHQDNLERWELKRLEKGQTRHTQSDVQNYIENWSDNQLIDSEPHYEVHRALAAALQDPARLTAWHSELSSLKSPPPK